jgi:prenyltransferase beta subunit
MQRLGFVLLGLLVGLAPARAQTADEKKVTVAYLQGLQTGEGGFLPTAPKEKAEESHATLRATSSALRALKHFGGEPKDKVICAMFVRSCFDREGTGGFSDLPGGQPDVTSTAVGLMAVVELQLPLQIFQDRAVKYLVEKAKTFEEIRIAAAGLEAVNQRPAQADAWLEQVAKMRNADGTYGKEDGQARDTGSAVVVVLRLGGKLEQKDAVVKALKSGQRDDGGFGKAGTPSSDLETCYRVMRAFMMLKEKPADADKLRAFIAKCRNKDGGYGVAPGQSSAVGSTYFASMLLHWLDEK